MNNKHKNAYSQNIESFEDEPKVLIFSNEGFISSYLVVKLLEFPLKVTLLSSMYIDEIQHLISNNHFDFNLIKGGTIEDSIDDKPNYIFQILDNINNSQATIKQEDITKGLLKIAQKHSLKYQIVSLLGGDKQVEDQDFSLIPSQIKNIFNENQNSIENNIRLINILDVYGPSINFDNKSLVSKIIENIHLNNKLKVDGEGLVSLFPIYASDVAVALIKAMFTQTSTNEPLLIGGSEEITQLNLIYKLRELILKQQNQIYEINFSKVEEAKKEKFRTNNLRIIQNEITRTQNILRWKPQISLDEGLVKTLKWIDHKPKIKSQQDQQIISRKKTNTVKKQSLISAKKTTKTTSSTLKKILKIALVSMVLLLFPFLVFLSISSLGVYQLSKTYSQLKLGNFIQAKKTAQSANSNFAKAKSQIIFVSKYLPQKSMIKNELDVIHNYLEIGNLASQIVNNSAIIADHGKQIKEAILINNNSAILTSINKLKVELISVYSKLALIETLIFQNLNQTSLLSLTTLNENFNKTNIKVKEFREIIINIVNLIEFVPQLIGLNDSSTYLILLQNNAELRPTGGFIGSYALVRFNNAKLSEFQVEDVYTADGQLKGHVEPPPEIKKYLGEAGWYLRDANWNPDFPSSAKQIEWFYEKEMGDNLDGVVAINLYVVQELLQALGPITLSDYEETITADNLFKVAEYYSEVGFFPGSTQKKDFLGSLTKQIFLRIENANTQELFKLAQALINSLEKGQLLLFVHDTDAQQKINQLGWDGSLKDISCSQEENVKCSKQYIYINEANVGVNKANYFINRNIDINKSVNNKISTTSLTITYKNDSPHNQWPGGTYKNYLRLYLDKGNTVKSILIDGSKVNSKDIDIKLEHDRQVIGFLVSIPAQAKIIVEIDLESQGLKFQDGKGQIAFLLQKQPGTQNDPISFSLNFPQDVSISSPSLQSFVTNNTLRRSQLFEKDLYMFIDLVNGQ